MGVSTSSGVSQPVTLINIDNVRQSKLDNPILHLFKTNDIASVITGTLTTDRSTIGTRSDNQGIVRTEAIDAPREEASGWLQEGASTNLYLHSEDFTNAVWANLRTSIAAGVLAPDGSSTADLIVEDGSNGTHSQRQNVTVVSGTPYTHTAYAKLKDRNMGFEFRTSSFGTRSRVVFNLTTGIASVVEGTFDKTSIQVLANGWFRCTATKTATASETVFAVELNAVNGTSFFYQGDSSSGVHVWGGSIEELDMPSSYIKTTTAAVTRTLDDTNHNIQDNIPALANSWTTTMFIDNPENDFYIFEESVTSYALLVNSSGDLVIETDSGTQHTLASAVDFTVQKYVAVVYDGTNVQAYIDGVAQAAVAATFANITSGTIRYGNNDAGTKPMYGHLLDFRAYDNLALNADEIKLLGGA